MRFGGVFFGVGTLAALPNLKNPPLLSLPGLLLLLPLLLLFFAGGGAAPLFLLLLFAGAGAGAGEGGGLLLPPYRLWSTLKRFLLVTTVRG